ncbi:MAG: LicD family protein [Clostridiales bacterium]|nr:LicD family protein [Clostridiales bacterium]
MSKIYSDNFGEHELNKLHRVQIEILDEISRICEANKITYYLVGGTLLGAVRHEGFIPWDDDLDIAMPRKDYEKFCSCCLSGELDRKYFLHNELTDDKYWLIFGKVRKNGTEINEKTNEKLETNKGIYVDIFPFDEVKKKASSFGKARTAIIKAISASICWKRGLRPPLTRRLKTILLITKPFSISVLSAIQKRLMIMGNDKGSPFYINYGSNYDTVKQTIPKDKYEPYCLLNFEGKKYRAPKDYDYVLRQIYDDYMTLPPVEDRVLRHKPVYIDFGES